MCKCSSLPTTELWCGNNWYNLSIYFVKKMYCVCWNKKIGSVYVSDIHEKYMHKKVINIMAYIY